MDCLLLPERGLRGTAREGVLPAEQAEGAAALRDSLDLL